MEKQSSCCCSCRVVNVVSCSFGRDSIAMLLVMLENPDGTGTSYEDRAEIFNLSIYDFEADEFREGTDKGVITLYARWKDTKSTLHIDGGGRLL